MHGGFLKKMGKLR